MKETIPQDSIQLTRGSGHFILSPPAPLQIYPNLHFPQSSQSFPLVSKQRHHCFLFFNQDGICLPSVPLNVADGR